MRKSYPSDITRRQFEAIRPILEGAKKRTKPRMVDLYDVFCSVMYLLDEGCTWRGLPGDFPKWRTVNSYFYIWKEPREGGRKICTVRPSWEGKEKEDHDGYR